MPYCAHTAAQVSGLSCSYSTSLEVSEPYADTNCMHLIKSCYIYVCKTPTHKKCDKGSCTIWLQKAVSLSWSKWPKNPQHWKKFPMAALFLLVTVIIWKSCWNMVLGPPEQQKVLHSLFISIERVLSRTDPALHAAQYRNCSMTSVHQTLTSLKGTAGILNKLCSL